MTAPDAESGPPTEDRPPFEEPWQAEAFAMTLHLHATGAFTWREWAEALAGHLRRSGPQLDASNYYQAWVGALETLAAAKGLVRRDAMELRKAAWRNAYIETPHGQAVALRSSNLPRQGG